MLINHRVYNYTMLMEVGNDNIGYEQAFVLPDGEKIGKMQ